MPYCPSCNVHFSTKPYRRWFCSSGCCDEALALLDTPDWMLIRKVPGAELETKESRLYEYIARLEARLSEREDEVKALEGKIKELEWELQSTR